MRKHRLQLKLNPRSQALDRLWVSSCSKKGAPRLHQRSSLLQGIAAAVGSLSGVADDMGQSCLGDLAGKRCALLNPVPEGRVELVDCQFDFVS